MVRESLDILKKWGLSLFLGTVPIFWAVSVFSQNITISASVDKNVLDMDEQLYLQVNVSGDSSIPQPNIPVINGFSTYSSGRSQNISIVNGKMSSSVTFNYVLVPNAPGKYTIGAITLDHKGMTYKTEPINVEVKKSGSGTQRGSLHSEKETVPSGKSGRDIFITTSVDKRNAYVNEQITLSFKFYRRVRLSSNPQYSPPSLTGFWVEDLPPQKNYNATIDGKQYMVTEIKTALFPTSPGKYTIGSATLNCNMDDFDGFFNDDFFKNFFSQGKRVSLKSDPITINVIALPENKPKGYKGTVGNYNISASVDKTRIQTGQPATLTITVSGSGNIKTIAEPNLPDLNGLRKYETVSSLNVSKQNYIVSGSKVFKTVLIPQVSGKLQIPQISFSVFDTNEKLYKTLTTQTISLDVLQGPKQDNMVMNQSNNVSSPEGVKLIEKDIRYIKSNTYFRKNNEHIYESPVFMFLQFVPLISLFFVFNYKRHTDRLSRDIRYARLKTASKLARKHLSKAKSLLAKNNPKEFYSKLSESIYSFIAGKLGVSSVGLTIRQIEEELMLKNIAVEIIDEVKTLLEECDFARFAPSKSTMENMEKNYEKATQIISKLQNVM